MGIQNQSMNKEQMDKYLVKICFMHMEVLVHQCGYHMGVTCRFTQVEILFLGEVMVLLKRISSSVLDSFDLFNECVNLLFLICGIKRKCKGPSRW